MGRCCLKECGLGCAYDLIFFFVCHFKLSIDIYFFSIRCIKTDGILCDQ